MPIRINLLAEDQAAEEMRRKDPVKRAIWLAGFVVFLVLLWSLTIFLQTSIARLDRSSLASKWKDLEPAVKRVEADRRQTTQVEQKLAAVAQFTTNRFLWASALNGLQQSCVDRIQLVRFKAEQVYFDKDGPKPAAGAAPGAAPPPKSGLSVEKIVVQLTGRDYSPREAEQVPHYKEVLANAPVFQASLQKTNNILLTSLTPPQIDGQKKETCVVFCLQLNFQEKERRLQ